MSASREKKQRQGAGPSEKAVKATNEQAAYKRKTRSYTVIGIVVVVLIAVLLIWGSSPVQGGMTAATVGSEKLSVAELGYYYNSYRYNYVMYGLVDPSKSDASQSIGGDKSIRDMLLESALSSVQETTAMYDAAIKAGYKDSDVAEDLAASIESVKAAAAAESTSYKSYLKAMYGTYMTPGIFKDILTKNLVVNSFYNDKHAEVSDSFTDADFQAYYDEHKDELDEFEYSYLQFKPTAVSNKDADGKELSEDEVKKLQEEANAEAKAKAEEALAAYNKGTSVEDLIKEFTPSSSSDHRVSQGTGSISASYSEELLKLGEDEAALVDAETNGFYVVVFHSRARNEQLSANIRHILFRAEHTVGTDNKVVAPDLKTLTKAETDAKAALDEFLAGAKTSESFAELANKYSQDNSSNTNGGLYEQVVEGQFGTELNDWIFGEEQPEVGATAVIRHDGDTANANSYWGYHVMYLDSWDMAFWALDARQALISESMENWRTELIKNGYDAALAKGAENLGN